jgi:hypothetical protein
MNTTVPTFKWIFCALISLNPALFAQIAPSGYSPTNQATGQLMPLQLRWDFGATRNYIVNGGFEVALAGWETHNSGPNFSAVTSSPAVGSASAVAGPGAAGFATLAQTVRVPEEPDVVALRWKSFMRTESVGGNASFLHVTVYDTNGVSLERVFTTNRVDSRATRWTPNAVDVTAYRGRTVKIAFEFDNALSSTTSCGIDEVALIGRSAADGMFQVFVGTNTPLVETNLYAESLLPFAQVDALADNTRFYWKVVLKHGETALEGLTQFFNTGASSGARSTRLRGPESPALTGTANPYTLEFLDGLGRLAPVQQAQVAVAAIGKTAAQPKMLITEIDPRTPNVVELMNISDELIPLKGWGLEFVRQQGDYTRYNFPTNAVAQPGAIFVVKAGAPVGAFPEFGSTSVNFGFTPARMCSWSSKQML